MNLKINKRALDFAFLFLLFLIVLLLSYLYLEIHSAKEFCNSIDGDYKISIIKNTHYCNGEPIYKMSDGLWNFDFRGYKIDVGSLVKDE